MIGASIFTIDTSQAKQKRLIQGVAWWLIWQPCNPCTNQYVYLCYFFFFEKQFLINLFYFICFIFGCVGSLLPRAGFSLVAASGGYSSLQCMGFSLWWLLLLRSTGSRRAGFSSFNTEAQQLWLAGSRAQAQQL